MNLIKVPLAKFTNSLGTKETPEAILNKLGQFKVTEDGRFINFENKEITNLNQSKEFFQNSEKNIFIGGDHSITLGLFKEFKEVNDNPGIIVFDAHPDCITETDLIPSLIKLIPKERIILVGLRNWQPQEYSFLQQNRIRYFSMKEIGLEGKYEVSEAIMSIAKNFGNLYISIDADVLEGVSVGTPEPGGLSVRELLFFLIRLKRLRNFKAADLTELNPESALVGAKIIAELF